jgi:hypothetical protein
MHQNVPAVSDATRINVLQEGDVSRGGKFLHILDFCIKCRWAIGFTSGCSIPLSH